MGVEFNTRKKQLELLLQTVSGQGCIRETHAKLRREKHDHGIMSIGPFQPKQLSEMVDEILHWEFSSDDALNA